jgi:sugar/nucleoside kinase (ribokinase family)
VQCGEGEGVGVENVFFEESLKMIANSPFNMGGLTKGVGIDFTIVDHVIPNVAAIEELHAYIDQKGWKQGQKQRLSDEEFRELQSKIQALKAQGLLADMEHFPGGSTGNAVFHVGAFLRQAGIPFEFELFSAIGGEDVEAVRRAAEDYEKAAIHVVPPSSEATMSPEMAVSTVFTFEGGGRIIATSAGNAAKILTADAVTDAHIEGADFLFLQASAWEKFRDSPDHFGSAIVDRMMQLRWQHRKPLILALPTNAFYADDHHETFKWLIPSADYLLGNVEELIALFRDEISQYLKIPRDFALPEEGTPERNTIEERALMCLQDHLAETRSEEIGKYPVAFITRGKTGAALVYPELNQDISYIRAANVPHIVNTLGAGDASYSGFMIGLLLGMTPEESAKLAMDVAGAKLGYNSARIPEVYEVLMKIRPDLQEKLQSQWPSLLPVVAANEGGRPVNLGFATAV